MERSKGWCRKSYLRELIWGKESGSYYIIIGHILGDVRTYYLSAHHSVLVILDVILVVVVFVGFCLLRAGNRIYDPPLSPQTLNQILGEPLRLFWAVAPTLMLVLGSRV